MRPCYPRGPSGPYPSLGHYTSFSARDSQPLRFLTSRPLGSSCGYHLPAEGTGRPQRIGGNCRSGHHYTSRRPCHNYRSSCAAQRSVSSSRLHHGSSVAQTRDRAMAHGRQEEGSCSGGSYHTVRSGYLADGPASDSSSGPCHGSSSDSVLNCTDVSLQGVYGSWSTFRSSLSSDYDPFMYYGQGHAARRNSLEACPQTRPRSLDSVVNKAGCAEEQPQTVFSHVHYHRHRHHHYEEAEPSLGLALGSDEEQGAAVAAAVVLDKDSTAPPAKLSSCKCSNKEPTEWPGPGSDCQDCQEPSSASRPPVLVSPIPLQLQPHCCHQGHEHAAAALGRVAGCVVDSPSVCFHQSLDLQDDRSIHIHYGQSPGFCCSPELHPALLPVPLMLNSGGLEEWPCCAGAHVVWQKRVQQAQSEPQLLGPGTPMDRAPCMFHNGPAVAAATAAASAADHNTDIRLFCQTSHHSQGRCR